MSEESSGINPYFEELRKCKGKEVVVVDMNGKKHKGICKAIGFNHLNIVLMTKTQKTILKNILSITRKRGK